VRAPREILETTRAECRIEKITLTQSHRRVAGKVLYILYLKASVGQAETTHTRACVRTCVRACVRAHSFHPCLSFSSLRPVAFKFTINARRRVVPASPHARAACVH